MKEVYSKAIASIESTDDNKFGPSGGFTAVLSTPSLDRDGDRLMRDEWKEFTQERYPLDIDHGMSVADTVGSFVPYWDGDRMMMDAHYASTDKAQDTRKLTDPDPVTGIRHIGSVSVAFMTDKSKKDGEQRRELLNAGIVAVPSNRDAVILASKAASALRDAFSDATEGDVPEEVKAAVLDALKTTPEAKTADDTKDSPKPYGDVTYADPEEGKYPIDTVAHIRAALAYIGMPRNRAALGDHLGHVEAAIHAAARAHGIEVSAPHGRSVEEAGKKGIFIDVIPRLDPEAVKRLAAELGELGLKAGATASGVGGDGALVQAIHDASSHLGAACPVIEVTDEGDGASSGANKSIKFTDKSGQSIEFASHDEAREFFTDMLESLKSAEDRDETLVEVGQESQLEAFEKALDQVLTSEESPAEAAAASDKEPAPAVEAADDSEIRARAMQMSLGLLTTIQ
jgi:hypothetical protein